MSPATPSVWPEIVAAASTLGDRLVGGVTFAATSDDVIEERVRQWRKSAARSDDYAFERRLKSLGLDGTHVRRLLADVEVDDQAPLPRWAEVLIESRQFGVTVEGQRFAGDEPDLIPELTAALVAAAQHRLREQCGSNYDFATPTAHADLALALQHRFADTLRTVVDWEFQRRPEVNGRRPDWWEWVVDQTTDGLERMFRKYPVAARLVGTTILNWVESCTELIHRAANDKTFLPSLAGYSGEATKLVSVELGLSDLHHGHRSVGVCTFETADARFTIVYKPKDVRSEVALGRILKGLADFGLDLGPQPRILAGNGYGWVEFIEGREIARREDAETFYVRAGMLTAAFYALGSNDCHAENVLARGDQPVVIDAEIGRAHV